MKDYYFYLRQCPSGGDSTKIGLTYDPRTRLVTYQSSISPLFHTAQFDIVYRGLKIDIITIEFQVKTLLRQYIVSDSAGCSEWIAEHTPEKIEEIVDNLIQRNGHHIKKLPAKFFPVNMNNLKEVIAFTGKNKSEYI